MGGGQQDDLRSGTENTCGIAGLRAAVETYPADGYEHMLQMKRLLVSLLREKLPETTVVGFPAEDDRSAGHVLSVAFPPVRAETLLHALEGDGIYVGTGSACSVQKRQAFGGADRHENPKRRDGRGYPHQPLPGKYGRGNALYSGKDQRACGTAAPVRTRVNRHRGRAEGEKQRAGVIAGSLRRNSSERPEPPLFHADAGGARPERGEGRSGPCVAQ
ncbi:MAG: aminotransferase class V-fold PLP-dependent enzyme [Lachnospiraceae bacterium]